MDLSNAFEDGKTYLERLEERRKAGRVPEAEEASTMEALKERLREEYRKVINNRLWWLMTSDIPPSVFEIQQRVIEQHRIIHT